MAFPHPAASAITAAAPVGWFAAELDTCEAVFFWLHEPLSPGTSYDA